MIDLPVTVNFTEILTCLALVVIGLGLDNTQRRTTGSGDLLTCLA